MVREMRGIDYIFGLSGTRPLAKKVDEVADDVRTRCAIENLRPVLRGYTETRHKAKSVRLRTTTLAPIGRRRRSRHPLRRHQPRCRLGRVDLRPERRARPSRNLIKLHKTQACLRSHQLPFGARQSSPPRSPHRRLLVDDGSKSHAIEYATNAFDRFNDISETWRDVSFGHQKISTAACSIRFLNRGCKLLRVMISVLPPRMLAACSFTSISSNRPSLPSS